MVMGVESVDAMPYKNIIRGARPRSTRIISIRFARLGPARNSPPWIN